MAETMAPQEETETTIPTAVIMEIPAITEAPTEATAEIMAMAPREETPAVLQAETPQSINPAP